MDVSHKEYIWQGLFIDVHDTFGKKFVIGYRPPRYSETLMRPFFDDFFFCMNKLNRSVRELVAVGDFNIDLLKINVNTLYADFF